MTGRIGDPLIEHDQCEARLFADPARSHEQLLLALAISRALREGYAAMENLSLVATTDSADTEADARQAQDALRRAEELLGIGPDPKHRGSHWRLRHLIDTDRPRYEPPPPPQFGPCEAPMVRRKGICGRQTSMHVRVRNRDDGTVTWRFCCTRHTLWGSELRQASPAASDCPAPLCNVGGFLLRHFPNWDWLTLYDWAHDGEWTPPADVFPSVSRLWGGIFEAQP